MKRFARNQINLTFAALKGTAAISGWSGIYLVYYESLIKHINTPNP